AFKLSANAGDYATMSTAPVSGRPFKTALKIDVTKKPQRATDVMISAPVDGAVASGDVLMVSFWVKSDTAAEATLDAGFRTPPGAAPAPGEGRAGGFAGPGGPGAAGAALGSGRAEAAGAPPAGGAAAAGAAGAQAGRGAAGAAGAAGRGRGFGGFGGGQPALNAPVLASATWKHVTLPFAATRAYNKGEGELTFTFGMQTQTMEIAAIELENYGTTKKVADLPYTKLGYEGEDANAAWRKAAEARIDQTRKGELTVAVKDASGKPVRNAQVEVRMKKHAFFFGTAVSGAAFTGTRMDPQTLAKYKEEILKLFNFAVMENETKWPQWANEASRPGTIQVIDWLRENGFSVRGHNLVWPSWNNTNVPAARDARNDPAALAKVITDHITETTRDLHGHVVEWDVINEPFTNHDFMDILGRHAMVDWYKTAHAGDPDAKLFINDFSIISGDDKEHQDNYASNIQYLIDQGAPLDGIGLQSHFPARVTGIDEVLKRFARFAAFGKALEVTEFDINTTDEATQADYTRDYMTAAFSEPAMRAFVMWGFWEGAHWRPSGAMLRRDWSPKPNFEAFNDLVFKKWWTNVDGKTNGQGSYATRGFLGDYEITVKSGTKSKTVKVSLPKGGAKVDVALD
ncbi:MAG TPA: endo-1,4-beta-xylanase, partial [Bryobacteraceae bacterium]|nr:endo-1,4-beta-xylanase [Bryobacteraceae bacterium]